MIADRQPARFITKRTAVCTVPWLPSGGPICQPWGIEPQGRAKPSAWPSSAARIARCHLPGLRLDAASPLFVGLQSCAYSQIGVASPIIPIMLKNCPSVINGLAGNGLKWRYYRPQNTRCSASSCLPAAPPAQPDRSAARPTARTASRILRVNVCCAHQFVGDRRKKACFSQAGSAGNRPPPRPTRDMGGLGESTPACACPCALLLLGLYPLFFFALRVSIRVSIPFFPIFFFAPPNHCLSIRC